MKKTASAIWQGGLKDGKGLLSTESGALKQNPYGFNTRFEGAPGTNPPNASTPPPKSRWTNNPTALPSPPCT